MKTQTSPSPTSRSCMRSSWWGHFALDYHAKQVDQLDATCVSLCTTRKKKNTRIDKTWIPRKWIFTYIDSKYLKSKWVKGRTRPFNRQIKTWVQWLVPLPQPSSNYCLWPRHDRKRGRWSTGLINATVHAPASHPPFSRSFIKSFASNSEKPGFEPSGSCAMYSSNPERHGVAGSEVAGVSSDMLCFASKNQLFPRHIGRDAQVHQFQIFGSKAQGTQQNGVGFSAAAHGDQFFTAAYRDQRHLPQAARDFLMKRRPETSDQNWLPSTYRLIELASKKVASSQIEGQQDNSCWYLPVLSVLKLARRQGTLLSQLASRQ